MRHPSGELADRFHFLCLNELLPRVINCFLRFLTFCEITRDLSETEKAAVFVADGVDHDAGPEPCSVLANTPALGLEPTCFDGRPQSILGQACGPVVRLIETREMLANYLVRGVTFEALGSGIPACDATVGIKHVDCIVGDTLHQQPKTFFAVPQCLFGLAPLAEVTGNFRKTQVNPLLIADGIDHHVGPETAAILPDAPALGFETPLGQRDLERALGKAVLPIFDRIEAREMLSDDFVWTVTLEAFGTGIPATDDPIGIEHVDRVV